MGANTSNAFFYLVSTLFDVYVWIILLRILLQAVRADFYNPISQLVVQVTQPVLRPLQGIVPKWGQVDIAACLFAFAVVLIEVHVVSGILGYHVNTLSGLKFAVLKLVVLTLNFYTFSLFVQAILSWVGPGVNNPAGNILWIINEPLLKPVRRVIPPLAGLDLSPLLVILVLQFVNRLIPLPGVLR